MVESVYSPILKTKRGEAFALYRLEQSVKDRIVPFFDILALPSEALNGSQVQEHIEKQAVNIIGAWKHQGICYVDFFDVTPSSRGVNGVHPVTLVFDRLMAARINAIPVVGLERDVPYKMAVRNVIASGAGVIAIRLDKEDIQLPSSLSQKIANLLFEIGAKNIDVHVFVDFRSIDNDSRATVETQFFRALRELDKLAVKRIVFSASAMIQNMGVFKKRSVNRIKRLDYLIWRGIVKAHSHIDYADYGVIHPDYVDFSPVLISPSAKIRYTTSGEWIVVKGSRWRDDTAQHHDLAKILQEQVEFRCDDSWGGEYIVSAAHGRKSYGTLETWVSIDQNNHITQTAKQIARIAVAVKNVDYH